MNDNIKNKPLNPRDIIVKVIPWEELKEEFKMAISELELEEALERTEKIVN